MRRSSAIPPGMNLDLRSMIRCDSGGPALVRREPGAAHARIL